MQLTQPLENHLLTLMTWFTSEQALTSWSGPNFRYPYDYASFVDDLKLGTLNSFVLTAENSTSTSNELLAFGQFYKRLGRCHLGRLVVNPTHRGQGIAAKLIQQLCLIGTEQLGVTECSLFVLANNAHAIKAYEKFGFSFAEYPEEIPLENCLYMVKG